MFELIYLISNQYGPVHHSWPDFFTFRIGARWTSKAELWQSAAHTWDIDWVKAQQARAFIFSTARPCQESVGLCEYEHLRSTAFPPLHLAGEVQKCEGRHSICMKTAEHVWCCEDALTQYPLWWSHCERASAQFYTCSAAPMQMEWLHSLISYPQDAAAGKLWTWVVCLHQPGGGRLCWGKSWTVAPRPTQQKSFVNHWTHWRKLVWEGNKFTESFCFPRLVRETDNNPWIIWTHLV